MKKLKIDWKKVGNFVMPLIGNSLQTLPVVGTIITNFKNNTVDSPSGNVNLTKWDGYRLIVGLGLAFVLYRGITTMEEITWIINKAQVIVSLLFGG